MSNTDALQMARAALARIDVATVGAEATNSRDLDDWRDDINGIQRIARAAIAAIDAALAQQPAASGEPVAVVRRAHAGGRARSIGYQVCDLLPGANVQDGAMLYAAPQPAPAQVRPIPDNVRAALCQMLDHYGDDPRAALVAFWLHSLPSAPQPAPDAALRTAVRLVLDATPDQLPMALDALRDHASAAQPAPARVPRWIPVTEQLPEKYTEVLVAFCGQMSLASTGQYTNNKHDKGGWCYPAENNGICDDGSDPVVTHWMPLPEVPPHPNFAAAITAKEAP